MRPTVLADTSVWIHVLRKRGDAAVKADVAEHLRLATIAWSDMVRVELAKGVAKAEDLADLEDLDEVVVTVPTTDAVWEGARELAMLTRRFGKPVPATDILIFSCARVHGLKIMHRDTHFDILRELVDRDRS